MKVLSLFSGIGAFEKALDRLNIDYELVAFSEIDKYATKSYCAIHGVDESMNLGDITKVDENSLPKDIDLITYGFPCQDISLAGKQKGLFNNDGTQTRSGLFFEALRIIEATKPKIAIAENVKNLTGKKFKEQFELALKSLEEAGYSNYWKVLNAKDYGIPQNRERVFIISIRKDIDKGYEFPEPFPLQLRLKDMLDDEVDEKYYLSDKQILTAGYFGNAVNPNLKDVYDRKKAIINKQVSYTISTKPDRRIGDCNYVTDDRNEMTAEEFLKKKFGEGQKILVREATKKGYAEAVDVECEEDIFKFDSTNKMIQVDQMYGTEKEPNPQSGRIYSADGISPTMDTCSGGNRMPKVLNDLRIRKLTPKECWRLMGFDDTDFEKAEAVNSNSQLYKQAGNSIVVNVIEKIYEKLFERYGDVIK